MLGREFAALLISMSVRLEKCVSSTVEISWAQVGKLELPMQVREPWPVKNSWLALHIHLERPASQRCIKSKGAMKALPATFPERSCSLTLRVDATVKTEEGNGVYDSMSE